MSRHWLEISLVTDRSHSEQVEEALIETGALAVTLSELDPEDPILEPAPGETPLWQRLRVTGLFQPDTDAAQVSGMLRQTPGLYEAELRSKLVEDRDWVRAWLDHYHPMRFGRRLWICPRGSTPPAGPSEAVLVELDPGLAFGTGTHPSTALCLEWLDGADLHGARVLDYGCGSGILGIAALRLGARELCAVDIDSQALRATVDNAAHNGVASWLQTFSADQAPAVEADALLANILAAPLITLAPTLARRVRPGGHIVLSGILQRQADGVSAAYAHWFDMDAPVLREGWALVTGRRLAD